MAIDRSVRFRVVRSSWNRPNRNDRRRPIVRPARPNSAAVERRCGAQLVPEVQVIVGCGRHREQRPNRRRTKRRTDDDRPIVCLATLESRFEELRRETPIGGRWTLEQRSNDATVPVHSWTV